MDSAGDLGEMVLKGLAARQPGAPAARGRAGGHTDGSAGYAKLPATGGRLDASTVAEQLLHEVDDPRRYVTPDGVLDLSGVTVRALGGDRVAVHGVSFEVRETVGLVSTLVPRSLVRTTAEVLG